MIKLFKISLVITIALIAMLAVVQMNHWQGAQTIGMLLTVVAPLTLILLVVKFIKA
jgi:hypothetical protein